MSKKKTATGVLEHLTPSLAKKVIYLAEVDMYIICIDPKTLDDNPKNWRIHPRRQRETYKAFKDKFGWLGLITYNVQTKKLLDGHMRVDEAVKNNEPYVPVILKSLSEEEENQVLATLDNVGLLAKRNVEALQNLVEANSESLKNVKNKNDQKLKQLAEDLKANQETILLPQSSKKVRVKQEEDSDLDLDSEESESDAEVGFIPNEAREVESTFIDDSVLFAGLTDIGIPELLSSHLLPADKAPTTTFLKDGYSEDKFFCLSSGPFDHGEPFGTLGFYTEDYRFEDAYRDGATFAEYLKELDPVGVLTPDFSTYSDWPLVLRLYNLYRSRWCGRFWQELGFNIVPSLQALGSKEYNLEYTLETLPLECPVLALQCRKSEVEGLIDFIKLTVSVRSPEVFLLYGGEVKQKYLHGKLPKKVGAQKIEYRYLPDYVEKTRRLKKKGRK